MLFTSRNLRIKEHFMARLEKTSFHNFHSAFIQVIQNCRETVYKKHNLLSQKYYSFFRLYNNDIIKFSIPSFTIPGKFCMRNWKEYYTYVTRGRYPQIRFNTLKKTPDPHHTTVNTMPSLPKLLVNNNCYQVFHM